MKVAKDLNGKPASISKVDNGKKCNCVCIDCEQPVIAKNNKFNIRTSHFSHEPGYVCTGNVESYLHKVSKAIICDHNSINLTSNEKFDYSEAFKEYSLEDIRPDVFLKGSKDLIIEIYVRNKKKSDYYQKIRNIGIEAYEIDLSKLSYATNLEEIKYHVLTRIDNKKKLSIDLSQLDLSQDIEIIEPAKLEDAKITSETSVNYWFETIIAILFVILLYLGFRDLNNKKRKR